MIATATPPDARKVELVLAQLESLPALSPIIDRLLSLTGDERTNAKQIIELIETEPSLTARLLSLLARAEHGIRPENVTLSNAVVLLGFETVRHAALVTKVMELFGPRDGGADGDFDRFEFWKHCLAVACAARRIAQALKSRVNPEEAFVCGLLHDLGKVALDVAMPKSFARIVQRCNEARSDIADAERAILGVDHTVVGRRLAERWRLPRKVVETIWLHHQEPQALPASVATGGHVQVVQLADAMVRERHIGYSGNHRQLYYSTDLAAALGLSDESRRAIMDALAEDVAARAEWIGAKELRSAEVYLQALTQATEDLTGANRALTATNRRLERKAEYFAALGWLNHHLSPQAAVREVCEVGAETVRRALASPAALVFVIDPSGRWVEVGISDGAARSEIIELARGAEVLANETEVVAESAAAGTWILRPDRAFEPILGRYQGELSGETWLLPIIRERQWVGGALFTADAAATAWREEGAELEALSAGLSLAVTQAQARAAALALGDELAQINRERAAMHAELLRTKTFETIVAMAAGAAHELNNPLAIISGRAQMLRGRIADETAQGVLDSIGAAAHNASQIVSDLLEFARPRPPRLEAIALRPLAGRVAAELETGGQAAAGDIVVEVSSDTPKVLFDAEQLAAVFREVLKNALENTQPEGRRVSVKATVDPTDKSVVVRIADNGAGMAPEVAERAMDPFFSHRAAGRGRGLGLARARQWVVQNGGAIRLGSRPGEGTQVELRLRPATI